MQKNCLFQSALASLIFLGVFSASAAIIRVATYNLETYLIQPTQTRPHVKTAEARAKIRETIRQMNPDVLALQEVGDTNALAELRDGLRAEGLDYPFSEFVEGFDTNIHVVVLSKLAIIERRAHTNDSFLLDGRRFVVKRGFAELDLRASEQFTFTLMAAHLKSRLNAADADESEERLKEAEVLRGIIDTRLKQDAHARLIVVGDFNDVKDAPAIKAIMGRGKTALIDTRPVEQGTVDLAGGSSARPPRTVAWTYFYAKTDEYSRIDYIFISQAMRENWVERETYIPRVSDWGIGSDHRALVATFHME